MTIRKVTPSEQGGVVRDPEYLRRKDVKLAHVIRRMNLGLAYWRTSEDATLASTSVKSIPPAILVVVPGVAIFETEEESDLMMEEDPWACSIDN